MDESADKNMIDKDEYPQTAAIEERCVHMLADCGTRRRQPPPSAAPPPVPARRPCWAAWPSSGTGANAGSLLPLRPWSAATGEVLGLAHLVAASDASEAGLQLA